MALILYMSDKEYEAVFIDNTMLILVDDHSSARDSNNYNQQRIVGKYDYEKDELSMEIPPDSLESEAEWKEICRNAFEANRMDIALR